jgi:hypothetical protein
LRSVTDEELDWYRLAIRHLHELIAGARKLPGERWSANATFLEMLMRRYEHSVAELEELSAHHQKEACGEVKSGFAAMRPPENGKQ